MGSKRNSSVRKLELPPKFASALSATHPHSSLVIHSQSQPVSSSVELPQTLIMHNENPMSSSNGMNIVCSKPLTTAVAVALRHTQVSHNPIHHLSPAPIIQRPPSATVSLPVAAYSSLPQAPTFAITSTGALPVVSQQAIALPPQGNFEHIIIFSISFFLREILK